MKFEKSKKIKRKIKRKKNKEVVSAQSPQGLERCADAQRFLKKIRHLLLLNLS